MVGAVGRQALEAVSNSGSSLSNGHTERLITCIRFLLGKDEGETCLPSICNFLFSFTPAFGYGLKNTQ